MLSVVFGCAPLCGLFIWCVCRSGSFVSESPYLSVMFVMFVFLCVFFVWFCGECVCLHDPLLSLCVEVLSHAVAVAVSCCFFPSGTSRLFVVAGAHCQAQNDTAPTLPTAACFACIGI